MKIKYDKEGDIIFSMNEIEESIEEKDGVIIDFDKDGNVVAIEILNASKTMDMPNGVIYEVA